MNTLIWFLVRSLGLHKHRPSRVLSTVTSALCLFRHLHNLRKADPRRDVDAVSVVIHAMVVSWGCVGRKERAVLPVYTDSGHTTYICRTPVILKRRRHVLRCIPIMLFGPARLG